MRALSEVEASIQTASFSQSLTLQHAIRPHPFLCDRAGSWSGIIAPLERQTDGLHANAKTQGENEITQLTVATPGSVPEPEEIVEDLDEALEVIPITSL